MSFLYPAFLIGALAIALPIALHLLRRDVAPDVPFTAVRLLRRAPIEQTRRRRLRDLLLLAARVAALLMLAAAFARPYLGGAAAGSPLHVIAVDRSYSMGPAARFARALELAGGALDAAGGATPVALLAFDDRAEVISAPGGAAAARAALDRLRPGFGSTRYEPVLARALELAHGGPFRLTIVTDLQRGGWAEGGAVRIPAGAQIEILDAGEPPGNVGVVGVRRTAAGVVATVRNDRGEDVSLEPRLVEGNRVVATTRASVPAGRTVEVPVPYGAGGAGALAVQIDDREGYPADDVRYVVVEGPGRGVVVIGTDARESGFYLTRALEAAAEGDGSSVRRVAAAAFGREAGEPSADGAIVLLSTRSLDRQARERIASTVRAGGGLFIAAGPDLEAAAVASMLGWADFAPVEFAQHASVLSPTDMRHAVFRPFAGLGANLGQARFSRAWRVTGAGWDVVARFSDGTPALLERRAGQGRVVLFASDVDRRWNDFPLHPAFVPFAVEVIRYISPRAGARREYVVGHAPAGVGPEPGLYPSAPGGPLVALNVDPAEAASTRMSPEEFRSFIRAGAAEPQAAGAQQAQQIESRQSLWRYGLLLMLGALVAESFVGRARA